MAKFTGRIDIIDYHNNEIVKWYDLDRMCVADVGGLLNYAKKLSELLGWPIISQDDSRVIIEHPEAFKTR